MPDRWVNPHGWGSPSPEEPSTGGPWWRRWYVVLAAALVLLGVVALSDDDDATNTASRSTASPATSDTLPMVAATMSTPSTAPPTTIPTIKVPSLVGMKLTAARAALADRRLRGTIKYKSTARYPTGTVISQSRGTGAGVLPESRIILVVAKAPPPPPTTAPPPPPTTPSRNCDPSFPDVCLDPNAVDYDCAGGSGDGPNYVRGPIRVRPPDPFDLDREGDGWGCDVADRPHQWRLRLVAGSPGSDNGCRQSAATTAIASMEMSRLRGRLTLAGAERAGGGSGMCRA